jgi:hypothetical protein
VPSGGSAADLCAGRAIVVKRGTPEHPKLIRLAKLLGVRRYVAVGLLELLWHLTARYTPAGDVGKWSDDEIATALDWDGDPAVIVRAFVASGLVERHPEHRLIVHDWAEHADDTVKLLLKRRQRDFVSRHVPTCPDINLLPEPKPEPKPEPLLLMGADAPTLTLLGFDRFWAIYPKKRHKPAAVRAWKAIDGARHLEAILAGVERWQASEQWEAGRIEDPATFLRQRQWEDPVPSAPASTGIEGMADRIRKKGLL